MRCHVDPAAKPDDAPSLLKEGVGCESCHGAADRWRTKHFQKTSPQEKEQLGMRTTKELSVRAKLCASCHVGAGEYDVNHDLMAAGHPRLNFEFAMFLSRLPKHWDESADRQRHADFAARAWAVGQAASAEAALRLLADRAADQARPWPEFAEYDCSSCHHGLAAESSRQRRYVQDAEQKHGAVGFRRPMLWGSWYYPMLPVAVARRKPPSGLCHPVYFPL